MRGGKGAGRRARSIDHERGEGGGQACKEYRYSSSYLQSFLA